MIQAENLTKSFSGQVLFENISFKLNARERLGLVGRNGHGKTTLFRLIIGSEHPDSGSINTPKNYRIGYVRQQLAFTQDTILKEGATALPESELGPILHDVMAQHPNTYLKAYVALRVRVEGGQRLPVDIVARDEDESTAEGLLQAALVTFTEMVQEKGSTVEQVTDQD